MLRFYDDVGIFKRKRAHKKCLASYDAECIVKNSLSDSLFINRKKSFKYYLSTTVTLKNSANNGFEINTLNFYSKTKTVINETYFLEDAFNELINRIDQWTNEGSGKV